MSCDIYTHVECRDPDGTWTRVEGTPFDLRIYSVFGWLADVRNYSAVPPLSQPRGLPEDASQGVLADWEWWQSDGHSCSWFTVDELAAFDYDAEVEDRRVTVGNDGGCTAEPGGGEVTTYREFLGANFFRDLDALRALNDERPTRVIFWFDS